MPAGASPAGPVAGGTVAAVEEPGRLYRRADSRVVAGVASGLARHLRLPVIAVRIAFVALLGFGGLGALLYVAYWAVLPVAPTGAPAAPRKRDTAQLVAFVALGLGVVIIQALSGGGGLQATIGWLIAVVALGAGVIWHQADPQRRRRWSEAAPEMPWLAGYFTENDRRALLLRLGGGGVLVIVGIIGTIAVLNPVRGAGYGSVVNGLLFSLVALAGLAVVLGPLIWRVFMQLRTEREGRIREQERAEFAGIVHDQVLHTLALIQRNSEDPKAVLRLARVQERTLRNWLYKPTASPDEKFEAALESAVTEVEDAFAVSVDLVVVGDCAVDDHVRALVQAAREATVNAAKHAKVDTVSVYAEVEPDQLSVFVRDRGIGFDPAGVDDDRHGVRGSIIARMERHGGAATIRSAPGEGTEVRLTMPRVRED